MYDIKVLGLTEAEVGIKAVVEEAKKGLPVAVAVVDSVGRLIMFARMDGAKKVTELMSQKKAFSAAALGRDTRATMDRHKSQGIITGVDFGAQFTWVPGGYVILDPDGQIVGAIGISGRPTAEDEALSALGKEAVEKHLREKAK